MFLSLADANVLASALDMEDREVGRRIDSKSMAVAEAERIRTAIRNGTFRRATESNEPTEVALTLEAYAREYAEWQARRASDDLLPAIARPLEDLQTRSDGYGDRHLDRVRNSMNVISHNLRAVSRPEPPPEKPARPELPGN